MSKRPIVFSMLLVSLLLLASCGGGGGSKTITGPSSDGRIFIIAGNGQSAQVSTAVAIAPSVRVTDSDGGALSGRRVLFTVAAGGGSVTGDTTTTDANGVATAGSWVLGATAGTNTLVAKATDWSGVEVTFTATATVEPSNYSVTIVAGDGQTAQVSTAVATPPSVKLTDSGNPVAGASIVFAVTAGGGNITGDTAITDAGGIATIGSWTLGPTAGANTLTATAVDQGGAQVTFTATGTSSPPPPSTRQWTFMVFLAGDNSLSIPGIFDIDEMEAAGADPNVQVIVQAEFNPGELQKQNCDAACFNRPNFNTFRYVLTEDRAAVNGPNGDATDLGDRNMATPSELHDFVAWCQQNYPAEKYVLVLWNHGGGYTGLLEDLTTNGNSLMSIGDLPQALQGLDKIDILDFDMCLMGAYETLTLVSDYVDYVVFSEEVVPGDGNPYTEILDGIQANADADAGEIAALIVDRAHTSYTGGRSSTTFSAFGTAGYAAFETKLDALAGAFRQNLATLRQPIGQAAGGAQKYAYAEIKDLVHFLDLLKPNVADDGIRSKIDDVRAAAVDADFLIANEHQSGGGDENNVDDSNGLSIVLPSGGASDQMSDEGPKSFAAYQALYANRGWTDFLDDWLNGEGGGDVTNMVDQGDAQMELYLVWSEEATANGLDVDLWVVEPDGILYIPYLGTVTPNGTFSGDSYETESFYEGYQTNRYVAPGTYKIYGYLYSDPPQNGTECNIAYRYGLSADYQWLYPDYGLPYLSKAYSISQDPDATFDDIDAGSYSDVLLLSTFTPVPAAKREHGEISIASRKGRRGPAGGAPTKAQLETALRLEKERRERGATFTMTTFPASVR